MEVSRAAGVEARGEAPGQGRLALAADSVVHRGGGAGRSPGTGAPAGWGWGGPRIRVEATPYVH